jgi:hypothetical protein
LTQVTPLNSTKWQICEIERLFLCTKLKQNKLWKHRVEKYPIGTQDFETLITGDFAYVDKTEFVYTLISNHRQVFLSRPRRFGKSLFLTTLKAYFKP